MTCCLTLWAEIYKTLWHIHFRQSRIFYPSPGYTLSCWRYEAAWALCLCCSSCYKYKCNQFSSWRHVTRSLARGETQHVTSWTRDTHGHYTGHGCVNVDNVKPAIFYPGLMSDISPWRWWVRLGVGEDHSWHFLSDWPGRMIRHCPVSVSILASDWSHLASDWPMTGVTTG